ncbi:hypothetical protein O181_089842 [Austropuccinia psidii MF-1]|uniref:Uncharacterized protein n=1 Tax=Austropuccinia psidii MF-1 TaxID=1389203 RepID=A0A9Q3IUD6_9BASI|nr:hypothetical protein [Austropuccinia psidii MF-1]
MPIQELVQTCQREGVGNIPKPLEGGHELQLTHQELSGSGEDHGSLGGWRPFFFKDKVKKIKNWLKNQSLLSIDQKKELEMTPTLEKGGPVASTSFKPAPKVFKEKYNRPQKKPKGLKNHQGKGKGKENWLRPY